MTTQEATKLHERIDVVYALVDERTIEMAKEQHRQAVAFEQLKTVVQRSLTTQESHDRNVLKRLDSHDTALTSLLTRHEVLAARVPLEPASIIHVDTLRKDTETQVNVIRGEAQSSRDFQKKAVGALIVINAIWPIVVALLMKWIGG